MKKTTRRWVVVGISAAILALIVYRITRSDEWSRFDWSRLWYLLVHAHRGYLVLAVAAIYLSYFLRALRWKYFLEPIKPASLWVLFVGQILGFSAIFLIGRPGEVGRGVDEHEASDLVGVDAGKHPDSGAAKRVSNQDVRRHDASSGQRVVQYSRNVPRCR